MTTTWKFRRITSITDGGDTYPGIRIKCIIKKNLFFSSLEISHSFMGKKDKNGKNILLINENGTKAHPGHSYLVSRWTDYPFCLPNEPRGTAREKVTEIASSCSSIPSQWQPDYTSETFFRIQPLDFPIPKRGKKKKNIM